MVKKIQTLRKIGNSCYVCVPIKIRQKFKVDDGDDLEINYTPVLNEEGADQ